MTQNHGGYRQPAKRQHGIYNKADAIGREPVISSIGVDIDVKQEGCSITTAASRLADVMTGTDCKQAKQMLLPICSAIAISISGCSSAKHCKLAEW